jgi:DNA primase
MNNSFRFGKEFVEAVREASPIEDIVAESVVVRRTGVQLLGRCPFHADKTPSFTVHPGKHVFHCHGCGAGGDVFRLVELLLHCTFRQALEYLAERSGIALEGFKPSPELAQQLEEQRAVREAEQAFARFCDERIATVSARYRRLSHAATHAENYLRSGNDDPYLRDFAWQALERFRIYEAQVEREGLADPNILRTEWEQLNAAA